MSKNQTYDVFDPHGAYVMTAPIMTLITVFHLSDGAIARIAKEATSPDGCKLHFNRRTYLGFGWVVVKVEGAGLKTAYEGLTEQQKDMLRDHMDSNSKRDLIDMLLNFYPVNQLDALIEEAKESEDEDINCH